MGLFAFIDLTLAQSHALAYELVAAVASNATLRSFRLLRAGVHPGRTPGSIPPVLWAATNRNYELMALLFLFGAPTGQSRPVLFFPLPVWKSGWPPDRQVAPLDFAVMFAPALAKAATAAAQKLQRLVVSRTAPAELKHLRFWSIRYSHAFPPSVQHLIRTVYFANCQRGYLPTELLPIIMGFLTAADGFTSHQPVCV